MSKCLALLYVLALLMVSLSTTAKHVGAQFLARAKSEKPHHQGKCSAKIKLNKTDKPHARRNWLRFFSKIKDI